MNKKLKIDQVMDTLKARAVEWGREDGESWATLRTGTVSKWARRASTGLTEYSMGVLRDIEDAVEGHWRTNGLFVFFINGIKGAGIGEYADTLKEDMIELYHEECRSVIWSEVSDRSTPGKELPMFVRDEDDPYWIAPIN